MARKSFSKEIVRSLWSNCNKCKEKDQEIKRLNECLIKMAELCAELSKGVD